MELVKTCRLNTTTTTKSKHQNAPPSKAQTGRQHLSSNNADHATDSTQPSHCCLAISYAPQSNSVALHFHPCRGSATAFVVAAVLPTSANRCTSSPLTLSYALNSYATSWHRACQQMLHATSYTVSRQLLQPHRWTHYHSARSMDCAVAGKPTPASTHVMLMLMLCTIYTRASLW